jgi:two-component system LytT family response regulator
MMIRVLTADDEALSRRLLRQLLARHEDVTIVAECADGETARAAISSLHPDVAFLDVRMPLETGLDVARARDSTNGPLVVFVTAFDQFALPAFEVDAVDYLAKPLTEERFDAALDRVRERLRLRRAAAASGGPDHLVTRVGSRDLVIPLDSVDYIEADDVYAAVVAHGTRHLVRRSLDALAGQLDAGLFVRVHRSYIVRLDRIVEARRERSGIARVVLRDGTVLPVARRRCAALSATLAGRRL